MYFINAYSLKTPIISLMFKSTIKQALIMLKLAIYFIKLIQDCLSFKCFKHLFQAIVNFIKSIDFII